MKKILFFTLLILFTLKMKGQNTSQELMEIKIETYSLVKIVDVIADDICKQLNELGNIRLTDEIVDPLFINTLVKHEDKIYEEYDFNSEKQQSQFSRDLMNKLMKDCNKYKLYTYQKIEQLD